jgi:hypothetical protein
LITQVLQEISQLRMEIDELISLVGQPPLRVALLAARFQRLISLFQTASSALESALLCNQPPVVIFSRARNTPRAASAQSVVAAAP